MCANSPTSTAHIYYFQGDGFYSPLLWRHSCGCWPHGGVRGSGSVSVFSL